MEGAVTAVRRVASRHHHSGRTFRGRAGCLSSYPHVLGSCSNPAVVEMLPRNTGHGNTLVHSNSNTYTNTRACTRTHIQQIWNAV